MIQQCMIGRDWPESTAEVRASLAWFQSGWTRNVPLDDVFLAAQLQYGGLDSTTLTTIIASEKRHLGSVGDSSSVIQGFKGSHFLLFYFAERAIMFECFGFQKQAAEHGFAWPTVCRNEAWDPLLESQARWLDFDLTWPLIWVLSFSSHLFECMQHDSFGWRLVSSQQSLALDIDSVVTGSHPTQRVRKAQAVHVSLPWLKLSIDGRACVSAVVAVVFSCRTSSLWFLGCTHFWGGFQQDTLSHEIVTTHYHSTSKGDLRRVRLPAVEVSLRGLSPTGRTGSRGTEDLFMFVFTATVCQEKAGPEFLLSLHQAF